MGKLRRRYKQSRTQSKQAFADRSPWRFNTTGAICRPERETINCGSRTMLCRRRGRCFCHDAAVVAAAAAAATAAAGSNSRCLGASLETCLGSFRLFSYRVFCAGRRTSTRSKRLNQRSDQRMIVAAAKWVRHRSRPGICLFIISRRRRPRKQHCKAWPEVVCTYWINLSAVASYIVG
jgi:hypothetical protein